MFIVTVTGGEGVERSNRSRLVKPALKAAHDHENANRRYSVPAERVGLEKILAAVAQGVPIRTPFETLAMELALAFEGVELSVDIQEE